MARTILSLLALVLLLPGCDLWDHGGETPDRPALLPLAEGTAWTMAFTRTNAEGEVTEATTDTLRVVGSIRVEGERWAEVACSRSRATCIPGGFYANREDGVWKWRGPDSDETPYLLYKYPARVGATYELPGRNNLTVTVLGRNMPIETPAGTLRAYHYELDTDMAYDFPVREGDGRFDRFLVPGRGFAFIGCSYLRTSDSGELVLHSRLDWQLIAVLTP